MITLEMVAALRAGTVTPDMLDAIADQMEYFVKCFENIVQEDRLYGAVEGSKGAQTWHDGACGRIARRALAQGSAK